jgi:hypothetical protein
LDPIEPDEDRGRADDSSVEKDSAPNAPEPDESFKENALPYKLTEAGMDYMKIQLDKQKEQDNKIPKEKRGEKIAELRKEIYHLRANIKIYEHFKQRNRVLRKELDHMKMKAKKEGVISQEMAVLLMQNQETLKQCKELTKTKLWKQRKFISSNDDEVKAAEFVLNLVDPAQMDTPEAKANMIKTYKTEIKKAFYNHKSYVAQEIKKVAWTLLEDKNEIPSVEQIHKCVTRNIKTHEEMELFMWYWDVLLPKMIGKKEWDTSVRYYNTISRATIPDSDPIERAITVSDEAMLMLMWDNSHDRWEELWAFAKDPKNKEKKLPRINGKYCESNKGQTKWGGWTPQGFLAYNKYYMDVKNARKDKNCIQVEKNCLQELRKKNKIILESAEAHIKEGRRQKRAKKLGVVYAPRQPIPDHLANVRPIVEEIEEEEDEIPDENSEDMTDTE